MTNRWKLLHSLNVCGHFNRHAVSASFSQMYENETNCTCLQAVGRLIIIVMGLIASLLQSKFHECFGWPNEKKILSTVYIALAADGPVVLLLSFNLT